METKSDRRSFVKLSAAAGTALALGSAFSPSDLEAQGSQEDVADFFEVVRTRRSVRDFRPDPVPEEDLRKIIDAARMAPTSGNQQPWKFVVIRDRAVLDELGEACIERSLEARRARGAVSDEDAAGVRQYYTDYLSAPVYVVVLTDGESRYPTYNHWDGPMAAGYLMLAARALGYGTVFVTDSFPDSVTKEVLNIPDRYTRVCFTPIGVPEEWPQSPDKKDLDEFIVYDRF